MLAYVFWHYPRAGINGLDYETALLEFQRVFRKAGDCVGIQSFRLDAVPWFNAGSPSYMDWHVVEDSAKLDGVNAHAVSGERLIPHNAVAAMTGGSTGCLYRFEHSGCAIEEARRAVWLSKPDGMPYAEFRASLRPLHRVGVSVLQRQMALGPGPEFCVLSIEELSLAGEARVLTAVGGER